jgi:hypothetical protein
VTRALALLAMLALPQDPARKGPPAFVPAESPAVTAQLRGAADMAREGRTAEAVEAYQAVVDGPLATRLAAHDRDRDTLEQARERALREVGASPELRGAHRRRFEETASRLLASALPSGDVRGLRETFVRFPPTDAGAAAGLALARSAWRAGDAEECLGLLDRLLDLHGAAPSAEVLALRAAAAAATGDGDLLEETARAAAALGANAALSERIAAARAALAPPGPPGPRGPLVLLWKWMPADDDRPGPEDGTRRPLVPDGFPPPPDHLLAVSGDRVYWTDRFRVTALDLATGQPVARSTPLAEGFRPAAPTEEHDGETFAPAADGRGVVAALDLPEGFGRRTGTLSLFDRDLRLLARRGGDADLEAPAMARRFVFHGRPLLLGDRVFCAATESSSVAAAAAGDVRTHVLAFRRDGLVPLWDAFVAYGSGVINSAIAPAGTLAHRHGRLYLATHTGLEACLDARTGALLFAHRYRTPEIAPTERLAPGPDRTLDPRLWYESPPVFSGNLVAFAPRDSYSVDFVLQRPARNGYVRDLEHQRSRHDVEDMNVGWVLGGPRGTFFLAGQVAGREAAPLVQRDLDPAREDPIPWRAALMEPEVAGLPVRAADGIYVATGKAIYRVLHPAPDAAERIAVLPPRDPEDPRPSPGNLLVLPDRILSVHDDGVMCFGTAPR